MKSMKSFGVPAPLRVSAMALLMAFAAVGAGCAADEADGAPSSSDAVKAKSSAFVEAKAVRFSSGKGTTVAASEKVQHILENLGLQAGAPALKEGGMRCLPTYELDFLDAKGETLASAGFDCDHDETKQNVEGSISIGEKSFLVTAKDIAALDAIAESPAAVGDYLFGVDEVSIAAPGIRDDVKSTKVADIGKLVDALDGNEVPDPEALSLRCRPSRIVTFSKAGNALGSVSLSCGQASGKVQGGFTVGDKRVGGVQIDSDVVFALEKTLGGG